jgi:hypothetical protein
MGNFEDWVKHKEKLSNEFNEQDVVNPELAGRLASVPITSPLARAQQRFHAFTSEKIFNPYQIAAELAKNLQSLLANDPKASQKALQVWRLLGIALRTGKIGFTPPAETDVATGVQP